MDTRAEASVEQQIRAAQARGAFDNLPGAGKPIADLDQHDEMWWVRKWMKREGVAVTPQTLSVRKQVDIARDALVHAQSEDEVRQIVASINPKIIEANRVASSGPPSSIMPFDEERTVKRWRERQLESR